MRKVAAAEIESEMRRMHEGLSFALNGLMRSKSTEARLLYLIAPSREAAEMRSFEWTDVESKYEEMDSSELGFLVLRVSHEPKRLMVLVRFQGFEDCYVLTAPNKTSRLAHPGVEKEALEHSFLKGTCKSSLSWESSTAPAN